MNRGGFLLSGLTSMLVVSMTAHKPPSATGGSSAILVTSPITISAAEILTSFTSRKTILAAVPGKIIVPLTHLGIYTAHGTGYDISGSGNFTVGVANDPGFPDVSAGGFGNTNQILVNDAVTEIAGLADLAEWFEQDITWGFDAANPINGNGAWVWTMYYHLLTP